MTANAHRITIAPLERSRRVSKPLPVFPVTHRPACDKCYSFTRPGLKVLVFHSGSTRAFAAELTM
jgi:hypothetical protein